nr:MAG TPA: ribonuclease HI [Bacteriophage sp.]
MMKNSYIAFTDGAYSSTRDQGGLGIIILKNNKEVLRYSNMYKNTTNNQMELGAIIIALRMVKRKIDSLTIYTDSQYCIGCAIKGWKRKKNKVMWEEFDKQYKRVKQLCPDIQFIHIKGHAGNKYNEIVDKLAVIASRRI